MSDVDQTPQEPENDTLEDDSNMADDENSTTILNNEESNLEGIESFFTSLFCDQTLQVLVLQKIQRIGLNRAPGFYFSFWVLEPIKNYF